MRLNQRRSKRPHRIHRLRSESHAPGAPESGGPHDELLLQRAWGPFRAELLPRLNEQDDRGFWRAAVSWVVADANLEAASYRGKDPLVLQIGCCSHWVRPHQTRYQVAGGFAAPHGYGNVGQGYAFTSLPEFDWSLVWVREQGSSDWSLSRGRPGRRPLTLRVALPARTSRRDQAAVHTRWDPGSPSDPKTKLDQLYFFRESEGAWHLVGEVHEQRS